MKMFSRQDICFLPLSSVSFSGLVLHDSGLLESLKPGRVKKKKEKKNLAVAKISCIKLQKYFEGFES